MGNKIHFRRGAGWGWGFTWPKIRKRCGRNACQATWGETSESREGGACNSRCPKRHPAEKMRKGLNLSVGGPKAYIHNYEGPKENLAYSRLGIVASRTATTMAGECSQPRLSLGQKVGREQWARLGGVVIEAGKLQSKRSRKGEVCKKKATSAGGRRKNWGGQIRAEHSGKFCRGLQSGQLSPKRGICRSGDWEYESADRNA